MVPLTLLERARCFERRQFLGMVFPRFDPRPCRGYELLGDLQLVDVGVPGGAEQLLLADA